MFDAWAVGDPPHFDPCGAVKGWAAERASALAVAHGLPRHVLNTGGVRLHSGSSARWPGSAGGQAVVASSRVGCVCS